METGKPVKGRLALAPLGPGPRCRVASNWRLAPGPTAPTTQNEKAPQGLAAFTPWGLPKRAQARRTGAWPWPPWVPIKSRTQGPKNALCLGAVGRRSKKAGADQGAPCLGAPGFGSEAGRKAQGGRVALAPLATPRHLPSNALHQTEPNNRANKGSKNVAAIGARNGGPPSSRRRYAYCLAAPGNEHQNGDQKPGHGGTQRRGRSFHNAHATPAPLAHGPTIAQNSNHV
jgi:hypothetical protein